jgi:hypothetical protein
MHKQWQWMCPIKQPLVAQRRPHARVGSRGAASNPVACGAARGVARRRRVWLGCSGGSGERLTAGGVA